ncbi:MAG: family 78 glycoside hydrolase catalytic domain, partial [Candidatus Faecivicinus sp.]
MKIRNLRTNHLTNPLGYAIDRPLLTWTAESATGKKQQSARIQISSNDAFDPCLYDSGLREDISSLGFTPDIELAPRTRYFWRVEVVADDGDRAVSSAAWFETGKRGGEWRAEWIQAPWDKSLHGILGTTVTLPEKPVRARIYTIGLGVYELNLNGKKVGDEILAPFYNDYNLWLQYQTYDVTDQLSAGENRLEAWLGNGWYKGRFGFIDKLDKLYGDQQKLILELRAELADGTEVVIGTDETWQCRTSPVLESSIYDGEVYDARLENSEWSASAVKAEAPAAPLSERLSPPVRVVDHVAPKELIHTPAGEQVIDFGQLMTGWFEFDCDLPEDAKVYLQCGELLQNDNFYNENLRTAKEEFTYISAGRPAHVRPHFTFYGFRFLKVTGLEDVDISKFTGCVIHSDIDVIGSVETSNEKVNRLIHNAFWGQIGNFLDTPTDCPQRDERMGWTGDAEVFSPTACFNMYTPAFYEKFLHDMLLEQKTLDGCVPHVVPDVLGQIAAITGEDQGPGKQSGSCAWADAATMIPWTLYEFYGDKAMLARQFENMKLWTDWIRSQDDAHCGGRRLWTCGFHFADWLALDNPVQGSSFGGTDPYYVASAYYYFSAMTTARAAKALGLDADYAEYSKLADEIKAAFRKEFFTETGRIAEPTQTAMALALSL